MIPDNMVPVTTELLLEMIGKQYVENYILNREIARLRDASQGSGQVSGSNGQGQENPIGLQPRG